MLGTLYARALASRSEHPILPDEHAERVVGQIDLVNHIPTGELALDVQSALAVRLQVLNPVVRRTDAKLLWGIDDPRELERAIPRLQLLEVLRAYELTNPRQDELPAGYRVALWLMRHIKAMGNLGLQLRYSF